MEKFLFFSVLIIFALMSITDFILYGMDKSKSKKNKWRIKESALLCFGFFGGALGGLLGMYVFRHKTKHIYFWLLNILFLILQAALVGFLWVRI